MDSNYLLTQYGVMLEIDITPHGASRTWTPLCAGFTNLDEALNEQTQEYFFLCAKGFGADFVIGMHPKFSLTGVRIVGDAAHVEVRAGTQPRLAEHGKKRLRAHEDKAVVQEGAP